MGLTTIRARWNGVGRMGGMVAHGGRTLGRSMSPKEIHPNPYRLLPSVDEALRNPAIAAWCAEFGRELMADFLSEELGAWRQEIRSGTLTTEALQARLKSDSLERAIGRRAAQERGRGVQRAINATGVVLHTGLGRSPVHPEVAAAMAKAAEAYCVLEVDRFSGERNQRDDRLSTLLQRLLGCEAAIAVNNNAAAAFLTMHTFAHGREAIVSRGELVEIGGSFRIPDVMRAAGVRLVEVGATNRTRRADYERAMGPDTGLLMKVHSSNFKMVGFIEEVPMQELAELGRERAVPTAFDLGSGRIEAPGAAELSMLGGETLVRDAVASGLEVVSFSGDKLLGGPQAGILVGTAERIAAMRTNPLYRATRLDKTTLAGLEATLQLYRDPETALREIPVLAMLSASPEALRERADTLAANLAAAGVTCEAVEMSSVVGGGTFPGVELESRGVRVESEEGGSDPLAARLRSASVPLVGRVEDGSFWVDLRTVLPWQDSVVLDLLSRHVGP